MNAGASAKAKQKNVTPDIAAKVPGAAVAVGRA
jgi:hypothetical protein